MEWNFEIFACLNCGSRFALRNPGINYYEILHSAPGSSYGYHYDIATKVKYFLEAKRLDKCERYLKKTSYKYSEVINFVKQKSKPISILEIGCSTGFMTAFFRAHGHDAEGIDVSETAIHYANSTFGPFYSLSPSKESYDFIFHLGLIGCVDKPKEFLSNYVRLLKSRGEMVFNAPNVKSPEQLNELWVSTPPPDLVYLFHENSFRNIFSNQFGVEVRKVYTKDEVVNKIMKRYFGERYTSYPVNFRVARNKADRRIDIFLRRSLKEVIWLLCGMLHDFNIFRKYENEYGLIVTINRIYR
jgi:2-polyprenyl-3-methyl-5-hydroxy-6-metoxy-1,4-benzoquinol methylase